MEMHSMFVYFLALPSLLTSSIYLVAFYCLHVYTQYYVDVDPLSCGKSEGDIYWDELAETCTEISRAVRFWGNNVFVTFVDCAIRFEAHSSHFFADSDWLVNYTYELLQHLDVEDWRFSWWRWRQQTDRPITLPLVHAQGIINNLLAQAHPTML